MNYKKTRCCIRFTEFLNEVKLSRNDKDIMLAGHKLVDQYRGFRYTHRINSTLDIINKMSENDKRETKGDIPFRR